jgi:hypothetical protein
MRDIALHIFWLVVVFLPCSLPCGLQSKESGMQFEVLVLGSTNTPRPHIVRISGYPPNLSVLDFLELAEAGKTFGNIQLMDGLKWSMMCLRKSGESDPLQTNQPLYVENGGRVIIGTGSGSNVVIC